MVSCDDCLTSRPAEWVCCAPECGLNMCEEHAQKHRCVWYIRNMLLSLHNVTGVLTVGSAPYSSLVCCRRLGQVAQINRDTSVAISFCAT